MGDFDRLSKTESLLRFCSPMVLVRLGRGSEIVRKGSGLFSAKTTEKQYVELDALCVLLSLPSPETALDSQLNCLPRSLISVRNNELPLWKQLMDPRWSNLFFVGMVIGEKSKERAIQAQCDFIVAYLEGKNALPSQVAMERDMVETHERRRTFAQTSARHLPEFDCEKYSSDLRLEMKRGAKRAHAIGNRRPIVSHAAASDCTLT